MRPAAKKALGDLAGYVNQARDNRLKAMAKPKPGSPTGPEEMQEGEEDVVGEKSAAESGGLAPEDKAKLEELYAKYCAE